MAAWEVYPITATVHSMPIALSPTPCKLGHECWLRAGGMDACGRRAV